jgi:phenylalanyl-tRNA synthetase beta chain
MECVEHNARVSERIALFELGPVFIPLEQYEPASGSYCKEPKQCAIVLSGSRTFPHWDTSKPPIMDFYDLKGIVTDLLEALHVSEARFVPFEHPTFHTGKCAKITLPASAAAKTESDDSAEIVLGMLGELHRLCVKITKELPSTPIYAALLDIEVLRSVIPTRLTVQPVPVFPPVLEI